MTTVPLASRYTQTMPLAHLAHKTACTLGNLCLLVVTMLFIMVALGGYTRLTGSGLSMVDWRPITGFLPPLTDIEWDQVFTLYKTSPEYQLKNRGMDLEGFKDIFWLEFIHRVWGRLIGIVCLVPIGFCLIKSSLRPWVRRFVAIWILGALQGLMGWYMVKSGLNDNPEVSPFRLCAHLLLAFLTVSCLYWTALNVRYDAQKKYTFVCALQGPLARLTLCFLTLTIVYGAFVAGMKAGLIYNTFPFMGDALIPGELLFYQPWFENFFMNPVTVQWTHRVLALTTFGLVMVYAVHSCKTHPKAKKAIISLKIVAVSQIGLGIATLVTQVQRDLAVAHQLTALLLCLAFLHVQFAKTYGKSKS